MGASGDRERARILWLEDEASAVGWTARCLRRDVGATVRIVKHVALAEERLRTAAYDFFLVDVRVPTDADEDPSFDAGHVLLSRLKRGDLGELNRDIPFAILTAHLVAVSRDELTGLTGCAGLFDKIDQSSAVVRVVESTLKDEAEVPSPADAWRTQLEVVDVSDDGLFAFAVVPAWEPNAHVAIPVSHFPKEIWRVVAGRQLPVWLTAYVHLGAEEVSGLRPFDFDFAPIVPSDSELGL